MTTPPEALDALHVAIAAAQILGIDVDRADAVRAEAAQRLGIAPDVYVLALVGGTGVGKSSLLNALAGREVSAAGPRRPTTARAVAWVPSGATGTDGDVAQLLDRLGVQSVVEHGPPPTGVSDDRKQPSPGSPALANVVVLDLPDIDSLEATHRAAVERALPKVDAVAWVMDPEKYADSVLHDAFLREWIPRLERQVVILNKVDRLSPDDARVVVADAGDVLRRELPHARGPVPAVITTRAADGLDGVRDLRAWLASAVDAKRVIADRIVAAAGAAVGDLAGLAGVTGDRTDGGAQQIIDSRSREQAVEATTNEVLRVVDLPGVERRAIASTRANARRRGTGPVGLITAAIYRATGRHRAVADPNGYLRSWRGRGGLAGATTALRAAVNAALPRVPRALRGRYAAAVAGAAIEERIAGSVDAVIARHGHLEPPASRWWPALGILQSANTLLLIAAAAWVVIWILARPAVTSYDLPVLGAVPAPIAWLGAGVVLGYVLARLLALHAGWVGRKWASRIRGAIRDAVRERISAEAFAPIDEIERARAALAAAWTVFNR